MSLKNPGFVQYTWATKPAIADWPAFKPIVITDISKIAGSNAPTLWWHDGQYWLPVQGEFILAADVGSIATPLATLSAITAAAFSIPGGTPQIPAGLLIAGRSVVEMDARAQKTGTTATASFVGWIGTVDPNHNNGMCNVNINASGTPSARMFGRGFFDTATAYTVDNAVAPHAAANGMSDKSTNINVAALMYAGFSITSGNVADSYALTAYTIKIRV